MSCENEITRPKSNGHFSHQQRQILFLGHRAETKSRAEQQQQKQTELTYQDLTIKTPFVSLSIHQTETFLECVNLIKESETTKKDSKCSTFYNISRGKIKHNKQINKLIFDLRIF